MKEKWKLTRNQLIKTFISIIALTILLCFSNTEAQAASTQDKALSAYNKLLSQLHLRASQIPKQIEQSICKFGNLLIARIRLKKEISVSFMIQRSFFNLKYRNFKFFPVKIETVSSWTC